MYWICQFRAPELIAHDDSYILTTDADVAFEPEDVKALLLIMMRLGEGRRGAGRGRGGKKRAL